MRQLPLAGKGVLAMRTQEGSSALGSRLKALGAAVYEIPLLQIEPPDDFAPLDAALARLQQYDLLLVTSATTVHVLVERRAAPWDGQPFTAAIGAATADAMRTAGLRVDFVPTAAVAESLLEALLPRFAQARVLLPRAVTAREVLPDGLRAAGAVVDIVYAYRTVPAPAAADRLRQLFAGDEQVHYLTFTSASAVDHFVAALGAEQARTASQAGLACSIGPATSAALRAHGITRYVEAEPYDLDGLVQVLLGAAADTSTGS